MRTLRWAALVAAMGCGGTEPGGGGDPGPGRAARLAVIAGSDAMARIGSQIAVTVRVTDDKARAVGSQAVSFIVKSGGGTVAAGSAMTNANGEATEHWTLGSELGVQLLEARAVDPATGEPIVVAQVAARATQRFPAKIELLSDSVTTRVGQSFAPLSLVARVVDADGLPMVGVPVHVAVGVWLTLNPDQTVTATKVAANLVRLYASGETGTVYADVKVIALVPLGTLVGLRGHKSCEGVGDMYVGPPSGLAVRTDDDVKVDSIGGPLQPSADSTVWVTRIRGVDFPDGNGLGFVSTHGLTVVRQRPDTLWFAENGTMLGWWVAQRNGYGSADDGPDGAINWCRWQQGWSSITHERGYVFSW